MVSLHNSQGEAETHHNPAAPSRDRAAPEKIAAREGTHPAHCYVCRPLGSVLSTLLHLQYVR